MQKVFLFDFDGTIADSFDNFLQIVKDLSAKYDFPTIPPSDIEKLRSEDARSLIKSLGIPFYKIPFIARDMKQIQQKSIGDILPFEGLSEVLQKLKEHGHSLGILTSNGEENVKTFLKRNDLDFFQYIQSDTSMFGKDRAIRKFLKQHSFTEEDVVYVGDEIRDIQACKKAGVKIISVTWGFNSEEGLKRYNPDFTISKPQELLQFIEKN